MKPITTEACNIPNCEDFKNEVRHIEPKRVKHREHTDNFRGGPVYTVVVNNTDVDVGPEYSFSAAGWLFTDWSEVSDKKNYILLHRSLKKDRNSSDVVDQPSFSIGLPTSILGDDLERLMVTGKVEGKRPQLGIPPSTALHQTTNEK